MQIHVKKTYLAETNNHYLKSKQNSSLSAGRGMYEHQHHHMLSCLEHTLVRFYSINIYNLLEIKYKN
jgi:hypothetical protein